MSQQQACHTIRISDQELHQTNHLLIFIVNLVNARLEQHRQGRHSISILDLMLREIHLGGRLQSPMH
jgi:hypothetical protein